RRGAGGAGGGARRRPPRPAVKDRLDATGPEPVADLLQPVRIITGGEPIRQLSESGPGPGRLPLGPLMAVDPHLHRVGEVRADLDEPRPPLLVPEVEVVARHPALGDREPELRRPGRVGVTLARLPDMLVFLRPADRHHP